MPEAALRLSGVVRRGGFTLEVALEVERGEIVAVVGPNGSGKSTLLRVLAGLVPLAEGRLELDGHVLDDCADGRFVPAEQRRVGVVFQDGRLFGHLRVVDNVAFGLRARGTERGAARAAAARWLHQLKIADLADRRPRNLSGGQAQRVALARALASEPALLLLDEPFAALDVQTRASVQGELREHLTRFAGPTIIVTHDVIDALVLADRIVVLEAGRVVQQASPTEITRRPATAYVAALVGVNLYAGRSDGRLVSLDGGGELVLGDGHCPGEVLVALRPSAVVLHAHRPTDTSARNVWPATVVSLSPLADRVRVELAGRPPALVDVTAAAVAELGLVPGREVWLATKATDLVAYPATAAPPPS